MNVYFTDDAIAPREHGGFVPHDELEISDDELARLKGRARKAVAMDDAPTERTLPPEYIDFLDGNDGRREYTHEDFLSGRQPGQHR